MTKNVYYRAVVQRNQMTAAQLQALSSWVVSYPRLLLEVFIRKNFGERYFNAGFSYIAFTVLFLFPIFTTMGQYEFFHYIPIGIMWSKYTTWYAFLGAFLYFSIIRQREIAVNPSVYDFAKYSLYSGDVHPFFVNLSPGKPNWRKIETLYEPAPFIAAGIVLLLIGQPLGWLLLVSGISYMGGYNLAYIQGDHFIMDKIDEIIMNEELTKVFVDDADAKDSRGVRFQGRKPTGSEMRQKVNEMLYEETSATVL